MTRGKLLAIAVFVTTPLSAGAQVVGPGVLLHGALWFDAKATLGPFRGLTRDVRGALTGGPALSAVRGWVEFDAAALATENALRDRDMRASLEVERFPTIRFDLDSVRVPGTSTDSGDSVAVELVGRMRIHGVTRAVRALALVRRDGELVRATGGFDLFVPDYGIRGLRKLFGILSMEETVRIGFDLTFKSALKVTVEERQ